MRRLILLLLVALILGGLVWPPGHAAASAVLLVPEFFPNAPARPLEWVTPPPVRQTVQFGVGNQTTTAALYAPRDPGRYGAVVIFLGVSPAGLDDPRVIRLGEGLARIGIVTLIPRSPGLVDSRVDPAEIDEVVAAFEYLAARRDVDPNRIGIGGFCIGAGLSLIVAEDPRINQRVALVNSFTGYADLESYTVSILTHTMAPFPPRPGVDRLPWEPSANAVAVLQAHLISQDPNPRERELLQAAVRDPKAPRPNLSQLSPIGRQIWSLLTTRDPETVERLLRELPPADQEIFRRLSPITRIDDLHARVFIMHDRADDNVPYVQSRLLAARLRPGQAVVDEFDFFRHVDPTGSVSPLVFVRDAARLTWHMFQIIEILQGAVPVERF